MSLFLTMPIFPKCTKLGQFFYPLYVSLIYLYFGFPSVSLCNCMISTVPEGYPYNACVHLGTEFPIHCAESKQGPAMRSWAGAGYMWGQTHTCSSLLSDLTITEEVRAHINYSFSFLLIVYSFYKVQWLKKLYQCFLILI